MMRPRALLHAALASAGAVAGGSVAWLAQVRDVPGQSHERMVLALNRDDGPAGSAMLRFIRRQARPAAEASRPAGAR
jgi:hypothetical protein